MLVNNAWQSRREESYRSMAGAMMRRRELTRAPESIWNLTLDLPPRIGRQLAIARIIGDAGSAAAVPVAGLFVVIGWVGFRRAHRADFRAQRIVVAGMTATLVVPAVFHFTGCIIFFSSHAGPLPFVSYGPGELLLDWVALALVASGHTQHADSAASMSDPTMVRWVDARG
jgi:hypothetical protein